MINELNSRAGFKCKLFALVRRQDGRQEDLGVVSEKMLTTVGAKFLADLLAGTAVGEMKYHASGTGNTPEAVTDTALVAEVATRAVGTKVAATAAPNATYTSVATITYAATLSIVEHGLFSAASAGTLLDRSVFTAIPVNNGDSIQFTYVLTINSGN